MILNPYIQLGSFSKKQEKFELDYLLKGNRNLPKGLKIHYVHSINDNQAFDIIKNNNSDIAFVYGTGKIYKEVFTSFPKGAVNAHGGKLPDYKGLDTNLWVALKEDASKMMITLHAIDESIDTGDIFIAESIIPKKDLNIYSLRGFTAIQCTNLYLKLIDILNENKLVRRKQNEKEVEYYTPMPFLYKLRVKKIISNWAEQYYVK